MDFTAEVKRAMHAKEVSQSELARRMNYTPQYIHSLLKGERRWKEGVMRKACDALGMEIKVVQVTKNRESTKERTSNV